MSNSTSMDGRRCPKNCRYMDYRYEANTDASGKLSTYSTKMTCTKYHMDLMVFFPMTINNGTYVTSTQGGECAPIDIAVSCKYIDLWTFRHYYKAHPIEARRERFPGIVTIYEDMETHGRDNETIPSITG